MTLTATRPAPTTERLARPAEPAAGARAVIATDRTGVIRHLSPEAEELLGYSSAELVGRSLRTLHVGDELRARADDLSMGWTDDDVAAVLAPVRDLGLPFERRRWTFVRRDTGRVRAHTTVTPVYDGEERIVAFVVLLEAPEVVFEPTPPAPYRDEYAAAVSHELRTPIAVILGYTEILQDLDAGTLNEQQTQMLEKIELSANRLLDMVRNVLRCCPGNDEEAPLRPVPVDLAAVVEACAEGIADRVHEKRLRLAVDVSAGPAMVIGSAEHIAVMVHSLLGNAVRLTPEGGLVSVTLTVDHDQCVLVVADSGCGIARADLHRVFTRFFGADSTPGSTPDSAPASVGRGPGLATAQAIATVHGGRIEVESSLGDGSDFVLRLPKALASR
jgi:signal transduction histidine kinase